MRKKPAQNRRARHALCWLIGINHRELNTFQMHMDRALELAPLAPSGVTLVAASGLNTWGDLEFLEAAGIRAFLIGETLVTSPDPRAKLRELIGVVRKEFDS